MAVRYPSFDDLNRRKIRESISLHSLKAKLINGPGAGAISGGVISTPTPSISITPTLTPTISNTPTLTPTNTVTPSITPSISITPTSTVTPSNTKTPTPSISITPSVTPTTSDTPTPTPTISITPSVTPTTSDTPTPTPTESLTPTITPSISITPTITPSVSITPSITPSASITPSITNSPTVTPSTSHSPTPTLTRNLIPSPTPTSYTFFLDGPGFTGLQGVSYNSFLSSRFYFSGTGSSPIFPADMQIYYNDTIVAVISYAAETGNNRTNQPFSWTPDYTNPNAPRFYSTFRSGNVYFYDSFPLSPTPTPTAQTTNTPTSTPTPTPTPTSSGITQNNILFDKSSFVGKVNEPYLTALNAAVDRWSTYLRIPSNKLDIIRSTDPTFNGITINTYTEYTDQASNTIASCGVNDYNVFNGGVGHQLITNSFNLNVNLKYSGWSAQDKANVITHELGHALGIGIYWRSSYEIYGSEPPANYFINASAYNALSAAYGTLIGGRPKVALENTGGSGTNSAHWENDYRNSAATGSLGFNYPGLSNELMVGYYSQGGTFKLSPISIKCLTDFGYEEINPGTSEGNPTLVNSLMAGASIVKFDSCNECSELGTGNVFSSNGELLYTSVIIT